ncbi:MAG: DNA polymerase III subunit alpha [Anaerolineae bacterium]
MYVELHAHSYFSLLDGASSPEALAAEAARLGMSALALTDHDGLSGAVRFWHAARERGIQPIIGAEVTLADGAHLTLLAETDAGYANLSRLLSLAHLQTGVPVGAGLVPAHAAHPAASTGNGASTSTRASTPTRAPTRDAPTEGWPGKTAPRVTWEMLHAHRQGIIALSGCRRGPVAAPLLAGQVEAALDAARRLREIFGPQHLFVELQRHILPDDTTLIRGLVDVARRLDLPLVATNNVHYATRDSHRLQDVLVCIRHLVSLDDAQRQSLLRPNTEFSLKGHQAMARLFAAQPDALANTLRIAERCHVALDFTGQRLPAFPVPPGHPPFSLLYDLCQTGLHRKIVPVTPAASRQLAHELDIIQRTGLAGYFLIVWDICRFAQERGIRYQGRGSAANSLVAYLLDITPVDPLQFNLLFERFLSEDSRTMPDIDIDFAADRREEVIQYVYGRYGVEHTGMVCNINTFRRRSAIRDVGRTLGIAPPMLDRLIREHPQLPEVSDTPDPADPQTLLWQLCHELEGTPRHLSIHVGGMLITAAPLVEVVPVERATMPGRVVAQWDKDSVEDAGLIKLDLLGLRTLGLVDEAVRLIGADIALDKLPLDDPAVYEMLCRGDTLGAFQVESRAQAQMLPRLRPTRFEDIVVAVAIIRPGPIQGHMVHPYLLRRQGLEPVTYTPPALEPILAETLGVILFQEQVLRVAMAVAGFSGGEADALRRAMSRQRSHAEMARLRERFVQGALANGLDEALAEEIFGQLAAFAAYGFCKSHAAAFALLAYQTLWLKVYHPAPFYCALLNQQPMGFYAPEVVIGDARRHGVPTRLPDINCSAEACLLEDGAIRLGLRYVSGLGPAAIERLLTARADGLFTNLVDLCRRTRLPRGIVENLIRGGALDELGAGEADRRRRLWELGALDYREEALALDTAVEAAALPELAEAEAMAWEYELLGMAPDDHILRLYRPTLQAAGFMSSSELGRRRDGETVRVAGLTVVRQRPPTAKGHAFFTLEDEGGLINLIVRPDLFDQRRDVLSHAPLLAARGRLQQEGGVTSIVVQDVWPLE